MIKLIAGVLLLSVIGCKGKDGEPGRSFTSSMVNLSGPITSDNFSVKVPGLRLDRGDILAVYACAGTDCTSLNVYEAGIGLNVFYGVRGDTVTIVNAKTGSGTLWYISALEKV